MHAACFAWAVVLCWTVLRVKSAHKLAVNASLFLLCLFFTRIVSWIAWVLFLRIQSLHKGGRVAVWRDSRIPFVSSPQVSPSVSLNSSLLRPFFTKLNSQSVTAENHRMNEIGMDLWKLCSPSPCLKLHHLQQLTQDQIQLDLSRDVVFTVPLWTLLSMVEYSSYGRVSVEHYSSFTSSPL